MGSSASKPQDPASLGARLAAIAHEIGTPLLLAVDAATVLRDEAARLAEAAGADASARARAGRIREGAETVVRNLDRAAGLLASYKRAAASESAAPGAKLLFPLGRAIRDALDTLAPALRRQGVGLEVAVDEEVEVTADPAAVAQIALNLVLNAARHAFRGSVRKRVEVAVRREGGSAVLEVRDDGRGIPPDVLPRIFDPFFTTDAEGGGTGLGLAVVRDLVERRLAGSIACASEPGQGTRFTVRFPVEGGPQ